MNANLPLALILLAVGSGLLLIGLKRLTGMIKADDEARDLPPFARQPFRTGEPQKVGPGSIMGPALFAGLVLFIIAYQGLGS